MRFPYPAWANEQERTSRRQKAAVKKAHQDRPFEFRTQREVELFNRGRVGEACCFHVATQMVLLAGACELEGRELLIQCLTHALTSVCRTPAPSTHSRLATYRS